MKYWLTVWRQRNPDTAGAFQTYLYETESGAVTIAAALSRLNEREVLTNTDGVPTGRINWECSCLQKKCGACAMLINGRPRLACDVRLSEFRNGKVRLEPLRKFPLVSDLVTDREVIFENLKRMELWAEKEFFPGGSNHSVMYEASRCLQCGCCLEVCPNFAAGGSFFGMSAMVPAARLLSGITGEERDRLRKQYRKVITEGCGKSLACRNICPAGIDIEGLMAKSNAAALWKIKVKSEK